MTLFESNESTGDISLHDLINGDFKPKMTGEVDLLDIINFIVRGGWPASVGLPIENALLLPKEYIDAVLNDDVYRVDGKKRDLNKLRLLLRSLARSEATTVTNKTLKNDIKAREMTTQLIGYLLNRIQVEGKIYESNKEYQIHKTFDRVNGGEYIEMWGFLDGGQAFLLRSPLESIRESVMLANEFLIYIGIGVALIGSFLVGYFSKRITKPILELTNLSKSMADLNFDVRYTSGGQDEIGVLGANFNSMSDKLEKTISELKTANYEPQKDIERKEKMEVPNKHE